MKRNNSVFFILFLFIVFGCGEDSEDETKGGPIGAPQVKPPVERNTPAGLGLVDFNLIENDTPQKRILFEVQRYLKPTENDAVGALERLDAIDNRMTSLDTRAQDSSPRKCLESEAKDYTLAAALPNLDSFAMKLNCQENLDNGSGEAESAQLAFGVTTDVFYLFERTGNYDNAVLAQSDMNETWTEFWQLGLDQAEGSQNTGGFIHLRAQDNVGMEITTAGEGGSVFDCGMHMKTNSTYVYIQAYDHTDDGCASEQTQLCLTAADMAETDLSNCTGASLTIFALTTLSRTGVINGTASTIIHKPIAGMIDFTEESEVPEEESES